MYEFTESDLKSNKNGFVSGGQREWLDNFGSGIRSTQRGSVRAAASSRSLVFALFWQQLFQMRMREPPSFPAG